MSERVVGVVRLSLSDDASTSVERQREIIASAIRARGAELVGYAEDVDVSASKTTPWERPQLGAWLARPSEWDTLIVWRIDRVARNAVQFAALIGWLLDRGKNLVSATETIDIQTPVGRLIAGVIASVAEMEADATRQRVLGSQKHLRRVGRWRGGPLPYGYRSDSDGNGGRVLVEDAESAEILREMVQRATAGESVLALSRVLNERGIPSPVDRRRILAGSEPTGAAWRSSSLWKVLRSETMRGRAVHDGRVVVDDDGEPVLIGPPLVDDATWFELQRELDRRGVATERRSSGVALLVGVAICGTCEGRIRTRYHHPKGKKARRLYSCNAGMEGRNCARPVTVAALALEEIVEAEFLRRLGKFEVTREVVEEGHDNRAEIAEVEARLNDLEADRYERGLFNGPGGAERFARVYARLSDRLVDLKARAYAPASVRFEPTGERYRDVWAATEDTDQRRELLKNAGARVVVRPTSRGAQDVRARIDIDFGVTEDGIPFESVEADLDWST